MSCLCRVDDPPAAKSDSSLAKRWGGIIYRKLFHIAHLIGPTLVALTFAGVCSGVAHAQGTMDFSGAQTLMGTFNMGSSPIQSQIVLSNPVQIISKQAVRTLDRQREHIRDLTEHAQCGMVSCTTQVRE